MPDDLCAVSCGVHDFCLTNTRWGEVCFTLGEVDGNPLRPSLKTPSDILLTLVYQILHKCLLWIPLHRPIKRIQQIQHTRRNNRLLHTMALCIRIRFLEVLIRVRVISQRTALETG